MLMLTKYDGTVKWGRSVVKIPTITNPLTLCIVIFLFVRKIDTGSTVITLPCPESFSLFFTPNKQSLETYFYFSEFVHNFYPRNTSRTILISYYWLIN